MAEGIGAPTCAVNGAFWLTLKMTFCRDGTKTPLAVSCICEHLLGHNRETTRMLDTFGHTNFGSVFNLDDPEGVPDNMYDIVKEFENKVIDIGIDIGRQETAAAISSTQAQCLISALEQRFPDFPDSLKDSIRQVTDYQKLIELSFTAGSAHSLDEIARQLAV